MYDRVPSEVSLFPSFPPSLPSYLQSRRVGKVSFGRLGVVVPAVAHRSAWGSHREPACQKGGEGGRMRGREGGREGGRGGRRGRTAVELVARAIPEFGGFVDELEKRREEA